MLSCSPTMLTDFLQCRKRLRLKWDGWRPLARSEALAFGGLWHRVLEELRSSYIKHQRPLESAIDGIVQAAIAAEESSLALVRRLTAKDREALLLLEAQLQIVTRAYCEAWHEDFNKDVKWTHFELRFETEYEGFRLIGRIDRVQEKAKQRFILYEMKTSSRIDPEAIASQLPLDLQTNFYCLVLEQILGKRPAEVVKDMVRRPGLRLGAKETLPQYQDRLVADIEGRPEHYFQRYTMPILAKDVKDFEENFKTLLLQVANWQQGDPVAQFWNPAACNSGMWACNYLNLCGTGSTEGYYNEKELKGRSRATKSA